MLYTSRDVTIAFFACNILATNVGWAPASNMPCATDASSSSGLLQKKYTQWHYITPHVLVLVNMAGGKIYGSVEDLRLVYEMQGVKIGFCLERLILGPEVFISRLFTLCPSPSHFVCGPQTSCLHSCKLRQNLVRKCNYEQNQQVQQWTKTKMNYVTTVGKLRPCVNVFARLMNDTLQHLITLSLFLHVCLHNESSSFWLIAKNWWKITYRASGYSWKISGPVSWLCCRLVVLMWYFMSFRSSATYTKKLQPFEYCCRQRCFLLFRSCTHTCIQMSCNIASSAVISTFYKCDIHTCIFSCYWWQLLHPCNSR